MLDRIVGSANESEILINGVKTSGLIDTGSMVTSVSEEFYKSLKPLPQLHLITEFVLEAQGANGDKSPYKGYIEAEISVPFFTNSSFEIPLLVVSNTEYNSKVPAIV